MASWSCMVCVAVVLGFLVMSMGGAVGEEQRGGMASREELDNKYILANEIMDLRAQVSDLEATAKTHKNALKKRDKQIRSLQQELQELQIKVQSATDADSKLIDAAAKLTDLDLEAARLKSELDHVRAQNSALQKRAEMAEAAAETHSAEKGSLMTAVADLKAKLRKAERSLQIAESGMLKAQRDAAAKAREMAKSADTWLPHWAAKEAAKVQAMVTSRWATHGQPLLQQLRRTATAKSAQASRFAKPYLKSFNKKVRPVFRSQWKKLESTVSPHLERVKKLGSQYLEAGHKYLSPHLSKVQASFDPLVQTVRERTRPLVDQAAGFLAPHFDKVNQAAGPYMKKANDHYERVVAQASTYHAQLQDSVKGTMGKHKVLASWATKELIWFLASALLALPAVATLMVFQSVFGSKKPAKGRRSLSSHHSNPQSAAKKSRRPKPIAVKQEK